MNFMDFMSLVVSILFMANINQCQNLLLFRNTRKSKNIKLFWEQDFATKLEGLSRDKTLGGLEFIWNKKVFSL